MKYLGSIALVLLVVFGSYWLLNRDVSMKNVDMFGGNDTPVLVEEVEYMNGVTGLYARPATEAVYPGVVMIHEWWGLNENIKETARQLAAEGYQVLAVDLLGSVATTPDEARALTGGLDQAKAVENLKAASAYLRAQGSQKVASLGWCFGGAQSLELATSGEALDATVIYYGRLTDDTTRLSQISWPVLGIFGAEDQSIPEAQVNAFADALTTLNIEHDVHIYEGVGHAFANPSGDNFAPEETKDAWNKTLTFLKENLY